MLVFYMLLHDHVQTGFVKKKRARPSSPILFNYFLLSEISTRIVGLFCFVFTKLSGG